MKTGERVRFIYNEAAVIVNAGKKNYLVIGDLHIGAEHKLAHKGIHVYNAVDAMLGKIKGLMEQFVLADIIILGDVKDSILYPTSNEQMGIKRFFDGLKGYSITIIRGNHDPHLEEIVAVPMKDELVIDDVAFMHGHIWPSEKAMRCDYIFAGHNHIAVSIQDKGRGYYSQKGWLVATLNKKGSAQRYPKANPSVKLVVLPAFNDLILGMPANEAMEDNLSPLFRNKIFDYGSAKLYGLSGQPIGTPKSLQQKKIRRK